MPAEASDLIRLNTELPPWGQKRPHGPFWANKPDSKSINRILDYLFGVDEDQWQNDLKATKFSSIMSYDAENTKLNKVLKKELGSHP